MTSEHARLIPNATVKFTEEDLLDILCTVIEGGIESWAIVKGVRYTDEGDYAAARIVPLYSRDEDFWPEASPLLITLDLQRGVDALMADPAMKKSLVRSAIETGDTADIDAEAADAIVQYALFGKLVYA